MILSKMLLSTFESFSFFCSDDCMQEICPCASEDG